MLSWRDILIYGLEKNYPRDIITHILYFLKRDRISHLIEESRNYHIQRMPYVEFRPTYYCRTKLIPTVLAPLNSEEEAHMYRSVINEIKYQ